jgi:hypothetical protein
MEHTNIELKSKEVRMEHTNIELIYSYTKYHIKLVNKSISRLDIKLGIIFVTSILSLFNLPDSPNNVKTVICVFLVITVGLSYLGLHPKAAGGMTSPGLLMKENYYDTDEDCRLIITKTWIEALKELETLRNEKADIAKWASRILCFTILLIAANIILSSFY